MMFWLLKINVDNLVCNFKPVSVGRIVLFGLRTCHLIWCRHYLKDQCNYGGCLLLVCMIPELQASHMAGNDLDIVSRSQVYQKGETVNC